MLTTLKITRICIDHIRHIEVGETFREEAYYRRDITITAENGDRFQLIFKAGDEPRLELSSEADDWITPKVYKGSQDMEE